MTESILLLIRPKSGVVAKFSASNGHLPVLFKDKWVRDTS